jgi:uncharacterized protein YndB with AHSA1/START domain
MRWVVLAIAGLALLALLLTLFGLSLPRGHRVTSRVRLAQPPDSVWRVLRDFATITEWWSEVKRVERITRPDGRERWQESLGGGFAMVLLVQEDEPPRRLGTLIEASQDAAFGGTWLTEVSPDGGGSTVQVTEEGWVANPLLRAMARIMGYRRTIDSYLIALAQRFGESRSPEHVE